jgi:uncharacterized membrane protein (UPF0127 family)
MVTPRAWNCASAPSVLAALAATALLLGCGSEADSAAATAVVQFDTGTVVIETGTDTIHLKVEVASTETQQQYGLMDRTKLAPDHGMLFLYDSVQDTSSGFWMFRTKIPLDVAFIDSTGSVVAVRSMEPCKSPQPQWCTPYTPEKRYQSGLEVNQGFFQQHGIGVGAKVRLQH